MCALLFRPNQKVVFIGDSITDSGRREEVLAPYGTGYMIMVRNFLIARYPEWTLTFENRGVGGNTIRDLKTRWQTDVIAEKPDVLSVMIGINDVWRIIAKRNEEAVYLDEYEATYRALLIETREKTNARLILADPYVIETDRTDPFRSTMDRYIERVHALAEEFDAVSVHTQEAFDAALAAQPSSYWADDRVHPRPFGHAVIAQAFLRAVGFEL